MLVTLEGIDGSGKTTVCEALAEEYPAATITREPTHTWYGEAVRRSLRTDDADPIAELFLYMADHADHLSRVIEPALRDGGLVLSDRYVDSRYAYQGATLAGSLEDPVTYIKQIHEPITRRPALTVYLDIDPKKAVERTDQANKFERIEHLRAVKANYERLLAAEPERFVRLDATEPPEAVAARAAAAVDDRR